MSRPARRKVYPLSMRLPEADVAVIDRAAALRGRSRTDFVREAAVRAAEAAPEMVAALKRPAPWDSSPAKR